MTENLHRPLHGGYPDTKVKEPTPEEIERIAKAMYDDQPMTAISDWLAESAGVDLGAPISWEKSIEIGCNHSGLRRLARAALLAMEPATP